MRFTITIKLLLAFLLTTGVVLLAALLLARWSFDQGFLDYVNALEHDRLTHIAKDLEEYYVVHDASWSGFDEHTFTRILDRHRPVGPRRVGRHPPPRHGPPGFGRPVPPPDEGFRNGPDTVLIDRSGAVLAGKLPNSQEDTVSVSVTAGGVPIAELRARVQRRLTSPLETEFVREQRQATWAIAAIAIALSLIISILLARTMLAPIKRVMGSVNQLADGNFAMTAPESRNDELGDLALNVQRLATTLENGRKSRQRWIADISHELRTPVTVLTAELHALKDGVMPLSMEKIASFDQEVARLQHLIDDLYQLSLSELGGLRYEFSRVDVSALLRRLMPRDEVSVGDLVITSNIQPDLVIRGDEARLEQLFVNLWRNAQAYTDSPGAIHCSAERRDDRLHVIFEDSKPGVPDQDLARLFDPLFRSEQSRNRRRGGAGLGLSICRNIVTAHQGTIVASASPLGGLRIEIELPTT